MNIGVYMEVDCLDHPSGVNPKSEEALQIPIDVTAASDLTFAGILTHADSYNTDSIDEVRRTAREERDVTCSALAGGWRRRAGG